MKRSEFVALLTFGVAIASVADGLRASVGLEFWHLFGASRDVQEIFITRFLLDLVVLSAFLVVGPGVLGPLLGCSVSRDGANSTEKPQVRQNVGKDDE
ncbi:hypothetical protein [Burkholderia contaminans]|uniref:hypothetical protein n=1 Tax=Burkholderia contaminans TaxID=488447 RepID=UPI001F144FE5|nr:hypothetical protein [Burkholderia contaminans]UMY33408.1 hypothetical protein MMB18_38450 [Burkholderia contaminans]